MTELPCSPKMRKTRSSMKATPGQVARILQQGDAEEHEHDQGYESEHTADTIDHPGK